jgi:hypothetical protein
MGKPSVYMKLERQIADDERGGVIHRWKYGRELLAAKVGRKQLPDGMIAGLVQEAERMGKKISEREIQYRIRLATVYATDQQVRRAIADLGTWTEIIRAGFPAIESDDPDELPDEISTSSPDDWEQLSLIPGLGEVLKVRGRTIALAEATFGDVKAYRDMYAGIHANFSKRLALIENAVRIMAEAGAGDDDNALDAWRRGVAA